MPGGYITDLRNICIGPVASVPVPQIQNRGCDNMEWKMQERRNDEFGGDEARDYIGPTNFTYV